MKWCTLAFVLLMAATPGVGSAADPMVPTLWDERERLTKPDLAQIERVRFLTTVDFPPFNFIDMRGRLSGLHVDLARAICRRLDIVAKCQIQALPWDDLERAMQEGDGEAVIAGLSVSAQSRERYIFTRPFLRFPARFIAPHGSTLAEPMHEAVGGERIGVLSATTHEVMLRRYFPTVQPVVYERADWLFADLKKGALGGAFGDGMRLSFWLAGSAAEGCCGFVGGSYLAPEYLGEGLTIAVRPDDAVLADAFNFALHEISVDGTFTELYLRYFPVGFY